MLLRKLDWGLQEKEFGCVKVRAAYSGARPGTKSLRKFPGVPQLSSLAIRLNSANPEGLGDLFLFSSMRGSKTDLEAT